MLRATLDSSNEGEREISGTKFYELFKYQPDNLEDAVDKAVEWAEEKAISVLVHQKGLTPEEAYRYCSLAVDFNVSQIVDINKGIHGKIPKSTFADGFEIDPQNLGEAF